MIKIIGKIRNIIYDGDNGYKVGLFRVKEIDDDYKEYLNKTITFTGYFNSLNDVDKYELVGEFVNHVKFGKQFITSSYQKLKPTTKDGVIEFLSSSLIKGSGEKTAIKIVNVLGENAIDKIKENYQNLLMVPGISEEKALKIYNSLKNYDSSDEVIIYLRNLGFTMKEALKLVAKYEENIKSIVDGNVYELSSVIDFKRLDQIFLNNHDKNSELRIFACILELFNILQNKTGDTFFYDDFLYEEFVKTFKIDINIEQFKEYLNYLVSEKKIILKDNKYTLYLTYFYEENIATLLLSINSHMKENNIDESLINELENILNIKYNDEQKQAIISSLKENVSIITGGPGTGKTTIINGIVKAYITINHLNNFDILNTIALLAPTGRAAKRMSYSTNLPAFTIHRFLKWNKEKDEFGVNKYNKNSQKLIIVDELSMVDTYLMYSLLDGIKDDVKIIFVGDSNQLPSVNCGNVLKDLIDSKIFNHVNLETIYRQKSNSYIPYLAQEIKLKKLNDFTKMRDDYNYLEVSSSNLHTMIKKICESSLKKDLNEKNIQILIPMYKGINGIDNINVMLQNLFNKKSEDKKDYLYNDIIFREGDKVLQLINNPDCNVFNGDIGYIKEIYGKNKDNFVLSINFDGNIVDYKKSDLATIKHAYAITIHKSQGSEFDHVILPIIGSYKRMLYNKLIYTGVSRAKKSLIILGEKDVFLNSINNDYSVKRNTNLKGLLSNKN